MRSGDSSALGLAGRNRNIIMVASSGTSGPVASVPGSTRGAPLSWEDGGPNRLVVWLDLDDRSWCGDSPWAGNGRPTATCDVLTVSLLILLARQAARGLGGRREELRALWLSAPPAHRACSRLFFVTDLAAIAAARQPFGDVIAEVLGAADLRLLFDGRDVVVELPSDADPPERAAVLVTMIGIDPSHSFPIPDDLVSY
jgi:hypothetical protein